MFTSTEIPLQQSVKTQGEEEISQENVRESSCEASSKFNLSVPPFPHLLNEAPYGPLRVLCVELRTVPGTQ